MTPDYPEKTYKEKIDNNQHKVDYWATKDAQIANARFFLFLSMIIVASLALSTNLFHITWTLLPLSAFIALIIMHASVIKHLTNAQDTIHFYQAGLDRIQDQWMGNGHTGDKWKPDQHLYAHDLDLFGEGSLFQLLNTTRTQTGESTLALWLTNHADTNTIANRQTAIEELRNNLDLRERIALTARDIQSGLHPIRLKNWAEAPLKLPTPAQRRLPRILALVSAICFILLFFLPLSYSYIPFMTSFITNMIVLHRLTPQATEITSKLDGALHDLQLLINLAEIFEQESFKSEILQKHQQRLIAGNQNASTAIRKLSKLFTGLELHRNQMFIPFGIILLWLIHFAHMIEDWRELHGKHIHDWMQSLGEIETLSALAAYAYEHPLDPYPEFTNETTPYIEARDLKHPLLPAASCIPNSVTLNQTQSLLIVSGSNMSGKSTYLRTIGINIVLAMMGAPVRCQSMKLTPCTIGASLHIQDSIQSGISHFYAEILRLKTIVKQTEDILPVLFLIDEILHGTNSHDRRIGTQAVINDLLDKNAIGLITTHDLALTSLESLHANKISNVHFQDQLDGDQLSFDYTVHEGIVTKSNALELMRSIGLKIEDTDQ